MITSSTMLVCAYLNIFPIWLGLWNYGSNIVKLDGAESGYRTDCKTAKAQAHNACVDLVTLASCSLAYPA